MRVSSHASAYTVTADIRPEVVDSKSAPQLCATVYYASGAFAGTCVNITQTQNTVQHVQAVLTLDSTQALGSVHIRLSTTGSVTVHYSLDNVTAALTLPGGTPPPGSDTTSHDFHLQPRHLQRHHQRRGMIRET